MVLQKSPNLSYGPCRLLPARRAGGKDGSAIVGILSRVPRPAAAILPADRAAAFEKDAVRHFLPHSGGHVPPRLAPGHSAREIAAARYASRDGVRERARSSSLGMTRRRTILKCAYMEASTTHASASVPHTGRELVCLVSFNFYLSRVDLYGGICPTYLCLAVQIIQKSSRGDNICSKIST